MTTLNKPRITELLALSDQATKGPWQWKKTRQRINRIHIWVTDLVGASDKLVMAPDVIDVICDLDNRAFIACAPELAEQLRLAVERIEELEARWTMRRNYASNDGDDLL